MKPEKPKKNLFARNKAFDDAVALSKDTPADTKALNAAKQDLDKATKRLETAMNTSFQAHDKAFKMFPNIEKTPQSPSPVPIPYPNILKVEKTVKSAVKGTEKALKDHEKAQKKAIRIIDKELKALKSKGANSSGNEAGTMKGLVTSKNVLKTQYLDFSFSVKMEGKNVTRMFDTLHLNEKKAKK